MVHRLRLVYPRGARQRKRTETGRSLRTKTYASPTSNNNTPTPNGRLFMLAATVGQGMMQFTQALALQATPGAATLGQTASLKMGGFNRNQIAILKDACGVKLAKDIPHIWYMIQTTKGKG
jgi:hypothetical protein